MVEFLLYVICTYNLFWVSFKSASNLFKSTISEKCLNANTVQGFGRFDFILLIYGPT